MAQFNNEVKREIGARLEEIIESQSNKCCPKREQLAKKLGVSRSTLCNYLNGSNSPNCEFLYDFSKEYQVSVDYLLFGDDMTIEDRHLISLYKKLKPEQAAAVKTILTGMIH